MSKVLKGDRDQLGEYLRELADLMGLRDWYLTMSHEEPVDDTHGAECAVTYGQKAATITFREDWSTWGVEEVRRLAVHELIHCHMESMQWSLNNVKHLVGVTAFNVIGDAFVDSMEVAIDGMAREWAKMLPLPIKKKADKTRKRKAA